MNKRGFIFSLALIFCLLVGWYIYVASQASEARSVSAVSVDWWGSAHADKSAEAFVHWNEDDPAVVPENCAKCHSGSGFIDFLGQDGSTAMTVDEPGLINSVITCEVCHNESADALAAVTFPSGAEIAMQDNDNAALCGQCHSGRGSGVSVLSAAQDSGDDDVIPDASFINPHYAFAAATSYGSDAMMGYQYEGQTYAGKFEHAEGVETCTQCHDPHSLHIRNDYDNEDANLCASCHSNVIGYQDYRDVTVDEIDYDNDGTVEGVYHEIQGVQGHLLAAIQRYCAEVLDQPFGWADQFPYVFNDLDGNGEIEGDEASFGNRYTTFSPRLMRTAFNYQFSKKDPAGYVHNGKYILQLLNDSIVDIAQVVSIDTTSLIRPE